MGRIGMDGCVIRFESTCMQKHRSAPKGAPSWHASLIHMSLKRKGSGRRTGIYLEWRDACIADKGKARADPGHTCMGIHEAQKATQSDQIRTISLLVGKKV